MDLVTFLTSQGVFALLFVWPFSALATVLIGSRAFGGSRRRLIPLALLGPIGLLYVLWRPYLSMPEKPLDEPPARATKILPAIRAHSPILYVNLAFLLLLSVSGVFIFFHPGWTPFYFQVIRIHVALGYVSLLLFASFIAVHLYRSYGGFAALLGVLLVVSLMCFQLVLNEMSIRYFWCIPCGASIVVLTSLLRRRAFAQAGEFFFDSGIALVMILAFTYFTGVLVSETASTFLTNNMALLVAYLHGTLPVLAAPLVAGMVMRHLRIRPWLGFRRIHRAAIPSVLVLACIGATSAERKWRDPPTGPNGSPALVVRAPSLETPRGEDLPRPALDHLNEVATCGAPNCHPEAERQWRQSAHRWSGSNDFYRAVVRALRRERGPGLERACQACHDPRAAFDPDRQAAESDLNLDRNLGVTCVSCHATHRLDHDPANGGYWLRRVAEIPPRLFGGDQLTNVVRGVRLDLRLHLANFSSFPVLSRPEFCVSCHRLSLPATWTGGAVVEISDPYRSWADSSWVTQGRDCRACHMPKDEYDRRGFGFPDHRFPGMGVSLSRMVEARGLEKAGVEALESFTRDWHEGKVTFVPGNGPILGMSLECGPLVPGAESSLIVRTTNLRIGHDFPGGTPDLNENWLTVEVRDAGGHVVFENGSLGSDGSVDTAAHRLGERWLDDSGHAVWNHHLWNVRRVADRRVIGPGATIEDRFSFVVPNAPNGPFEISARWSYRRANPAFVAWVYDDPGAAFPVYVVASTTVEAPVAGDVPRSANSASSVPEPMVTSRLRSAFPVTVAEARSRPDHLRASSRSTPARRAAASSGFG